MTSTSRIISTMGYQSALDLRLDALLFLKVLSHAEKGIADLTARLAGTHHADEQFGKDLALVCHRLGKRLAVFQIRGDIRKGLSGEFGDAGTVGNNVERLDHRNAGIQQAAQLAAEIGQFLGFQFRPERCFVGLGIVQQEQVLFFQFVQQCLRVGCHQIATHGLSAHGCGTVFVIWHGIHLLSCPGDWVIFSSVLHAAIVGADAHIRPFNPSVTYGDSSAQGTPCGRPKGEPNRLLL
jgi:hypothetical protein